MKAGVQQCPEGTGWEGWRDKLKQPVLTSPLGSHSSSGLPWAIVCCCNEELDSSWSIILFKQAGLFWGAADNNLPSFGGVWVQGIRVQGLLLPFGSCAQPSQWLNFNGLQTPHSFLSSVVVFLCSCGTAVESQPSPGISVLCNVILRGGGGEEEWKSDVHWAPLKFRTLALHFT